MKNKLLIALCSTLLLGLTACGEEATPTEAEAAQDKAAIGGTPMPGDGEGSEGNTVPGTGEGSEGLTPEMDMEEKQGGGPFTGDGQGTEGQSGTPFPGDGQGSEG